MPTPNRLLAVDAFGFLFRGYYAFINRPLRNQAGDDTSAAVGFFRELIRVVRLYQPTHIVVAFDSPGPTFRNEIYPEYKAQRGPAPDPIKYCAQKVKLVLKSLGIAILEKEGYEADDLIGTVVHQIASPENRVLLYTIDKDYLQLLGPHCSMLKPESKGIQEIHESEFLEKFLLKRADQFIDMLALMGDAVDNIPGVNGIGEKQAAKLISKYGSVENLLNFTSQLTPKQQERVVASVDQIKVSKQLATICQEVPIQCSLADFLVHETDKPAFDVLMEELDFRSMGVELETFFSQPVANKGVELEEQKGGKSNDESEEPPDGAHAEEKRMENLTLETIVDRAVDYRLADDPESFAQMLAQIRAAEIVAIDTETTGISYQSDRIVGFSCSISPGTGWYVPLWLEQADRSEKLRQIENALSDPSKHIVGQNIKFDLYMLRAEEVQVRGIFFDTIILHYLLYPNDSHRMDEMAMSLLKYRPIAYGDLDPGKKAKDIRLAEVPLELLKDYAVEDSDITLQLYQCLWPMVEQAQLRELYETLESPLIRVLSDMEVDGISIDLNRLNPLRQKLLDSADKIAAEIVEHDPAKSVNIDSPAQVGEMLFDRLKIDEKPRKTSSGKYSTNVKVLEKYEARFPIVKRILEYRETKKLLSTYIDAFPKLVNADTGRIHCHFNQAVASTGRLSSSDPNMQNIPVRTEQGKLIRAAFISRFEDGWLLGADYSQIELRLMAHCSQDAHMLSDFREGRDIHSATAARVFNVPIDQVSKSQRYFAKGINFGVIYGISPYGLSQQLGIEISEAAEFIKSYFETYPKVRSFMDKCIDRARRTGYSETLLGRKRWLPDLASQQRNIRAGAERMAINTPLQGTAADIIKMAMVKIYDAMQRKGLRSTMVLQVHDELIFDVPNEEIEFMKELVPHYMESAFPLSVPLTVDVAVGRDWGEL